MTSAEPTAAPARAAARPLGEATFQGVVAVSWWPASRVQAVLAGLRRVSAPASPMRETLPVVVLFGQHRAAATWFAGVRVPLGRRYGEWALAIPEAASLDGATRGTALVHMFADYFPAVWNGAARYGFGKHEAEIHADETSFIAVASGGAPLVHARIAPSGTSEPTLRWETIAGWFDGWMLGTTAAGRQVRTPSTWDRAQATVRPVVASCTAFTALRPGIDPGELLLHPTAAYAVDGLRWELGWPETEVVG